MKQLKRPHCNKIPSCRSRNKVLSFRGQQDKRKDFSFYNHLVGWLQSSFLGETGRRLIGRDCTVRVYDTTLGAGEARGYFGPLLEPLWGLGFAAHIYSSLLVK